MKIRSSTAGHLVALVALCGMFASPARAVSLISGNGNTDSASLVSYAGLGASGTPGFVNVGRSSTGNATVTYIVGRWVLTADHVTINTPVSFGGTMYNVDAGSITQLQNPDSSLSDLKMFRITTAPGLPAITPDLISSTAATGHQILIGNGKNVGSQQFWHDDGVTDPWPADATPASVDPDDYSGFVLGSRTIRWGENEVAGSGVLNIGSTSTDVFVTEFDQLDYTGTAALAHEAQGSGGDSGGAAFSFIGGAWKLTGIILAVSGPRDRQPTNTIVFGDQTYVADLSFYRDQILSIVPEPGGLALAATAGLALGLFGRRRRRFARSDHPL